MGALVCLLVFFVFLLRNPEGWMRRLSFACIMAGSAPLANLGSALKASGIAKLEGDGWQAALSLALGEGSPIAGGVLIVAGLVLAGLDLIRQKPVARSEGIATPVSPVFTVCSTRDRVSRGECVLVIKNCLNHETLVGAAQLHRYRIADLVLVHDLVALDAVSLEVRDVSMIVDEVEIEEAHPLVWSPGEWRYFRIIFSFRDRVGALPTLLGPVVWLLGLSTRCFEVGLGSGAGDERRGQS